MTYITTIASRVSGIPCQIGVTAWEPYRPGKFSGAPEYCYPDEGGYGEWVVLDRQGRPARWLERKLTPEDIDRIEDELFRAHAAAAEEPADWRCEPEY